MTRLKLLMTTDAVGGVWTYALDLAAGLSRLDIVTTLAVLGPFPSTGQCRQASLVPGLTLHETGLPLDWLAAGPSDLRRTADAIASLATRSGADLIHLNTPALAGCVRFDRPVVAICHSCVRTWWDAVEGGALPKSLAWQADLVAAGYAAADRLVAPSHAFAETTRSAYDLPAAPIVIHNGRHCDIAAKGRMVDIVFTAGRLWDRGKGVAALERLSARIDWPVYAAGPTKGPDGSVIDLRGITALGPLDAESLAAQLARQPIFVSLARYEPFGLAVLEAAQAGCALVLADTPGFRELWEGAASLVPLDDDTAAANAIARLMADRAMRELAGRRAAERALRYGVDLMAQGMAVVYRDALGGMRTAA